MGYSDSAKNSMLTALGAIATYASLHSGDPSTTGANELTGGTPAYARQPVTFGSASGGEMAESNQPVFDVPAGFVLYVGYWTAVSGGTFLGSGLFSPAPDEFTEQGLFKITSSVLDLNSLALSTPTGVGTAAVTAITASVTGYMLPKGTAAAALAELLPASTGYLLPLGTATAGLTALTADADGTYGSEITGTVTATLTAITSSGTGLLVPKGTAASDLTALTADADGEMVSGGGSVTSVISVNANDGSLVASDGSWWPDDPYLNVGGNWYDEEEVGDKYHMTLRFLDITIPQGSTITSAYIRMIVADTRGDLGTNIIIRGDDVDNSGALSASHAEKGGGSGLTSTTQTVNWNPGAATVNTTKNTPSLVSIVQEIVDRAGWSSGNAMTFGLDASNFAEDTSNFYPFFASSDVHEADRPTLFIEYA